MTKVRVPMHTQWLSFWWKLNVSLQGRKAGCDVWECQYHQRAVSNCYRRFSDNKMNGVIMQVMHRLIRLLVKVFDDVFALIPGTAFMKIRGILPALRSECIMMVYKRSWWKNGQWIPQYTLGLYSLTGCSKKGIQGLKGYQILESYTLIS